MIENCIVNTKLGRLQGRQEHGCVVFNGVPYAKPPVGSRRFTAPVAPEPWDSVRPATKPAAASIQPNRENRDRMIAHVQSMDPGVPGVFAFPEYTVTSYINEEEISEDCLYLDIWVPEDAEGEDLPVYIYYHGGANFVNSGHFDVENGANFAREQRVIVVHPTYRMGALGWVHFGLLDDRFSEAVNLGVKDQAAALKWVYEHIASFGGDPENITIGGESCGATAVSHLLILPELQPMIRRAVIQSLSPFNIWCTQQKQEAVNVVQMYLELLNISDPIELMEVDPERLLAVHSVISRYWHPDKNVAWRPLGPVATGESAPALPVQHLATCTYPRKDFELIIGFAKDEWKFFRGHSNTMRRGTKEQVLNILQQVFADEAQALYERYSQLKAGDNAPHEILNSIMSMEFFKFSSLEIAENFSKQNIPTFVFQFSYDLPGQGGIFRAIHTADTPFIFHNLESHRLARNAPFEGADIDELDAVSTTISNLYGSFIRSGEPGEIWSRYDSTNQSILWFGKQVESRPALLKQEVEAFHSAGLENVADLEKRLVTNVRKSLYTPKRALSGVKLKTE